MQKAATKHLMYNLTGKELFASIMQNCCDVVDAMPVSFSDGDLNSAKLGLTKSPYEAREFSRWCNARTAIDVLVAEIRVEATQANWLLHDILTNIFYLMSDSEEMVALANGLDEKVFVAERKLNQLTQYIAALDAFSDALNVNLNPLLRGAVSKIHDRLGIYKYIRTAFDDHIAAKDSADEALLDFLPSLILEPDDRALQAKENLAKNLSDYQGAHFTSLLSPIFAVIE